MNSASTLEISQTPSAQDTELLQKKIYHACHRTYCILNDAHTAVKTQLNTICEDSGRALVELLEREMYKDKQALAQRALHLLNLLEDSLVRGQSDPALLRTCTSIVTELVVAPNGPGQKDWYFLRSKLSKIKKNADIDELACIVKSAQDIIRVQALRKALHLILEHGQGGWIERTIRRFIPDAGRSAITRMSPAERENASAYVSCQLQFQSLMLDWGLSPYAHDDNLENTDHAQLLMRLEFTQQLQASISERVQMIAPIVPARQRADGTKIFPTIGKNFAQQISAQIRRRHSPEVFAA